MRRKNLLPNNAKQLIVELENKMHVDIAISKIEAT